MGNCTSTETVRVEGHAPHHDACEEAKPAKVKKDKSKKKKVKKRKRRKSHNSDGISISISFRYIYPFANLYLNAFLEHILCSPKLDGDSLYLLK